ncbi:hypothetical protein [Legionella rowbothamii]|uniref:hypothetical protein n=1 Tax=Legionella rowbothamii TaxID=96229 RepID=UPI0010549898|nr:hypothetical protein [Legionella rowbothamii]
MTNTNVNTYKFFTEINTVQNFLQVLLNQLKKSNPAHAELVNNLQAIVDGVEVENLPKELEPIITFLNKPQLIIPNLSCEGKECFNTAVKNKLSDFIMELRQQMNVEMPGMQG